MSDPDTPAAPSWSVPQQWSTVNINHRQLTDSQPRSETVGALVGSGPSAMPLLFSPTAVDTPAVQNSAVQQQNSSNEPQAGKESTPAAAVGTSSSNGTVQQREAQPQLPQPGQQLQQPRHEANPTPPSSSTPAAKPVFMMKRLGGPFPFSKPRSAASSKPSSPVTTAPPTPRSDPGLDPRPDVDSAPQVASTSLKVENDPKQLVIGSSDDMSGLDENHPIVLVESDIDIADVSASFSIRDSVSVSAAPTPSSGVQRPEVSFDDKIYKVFKDENGQLISSQGALLPPGYQKCANTAFPWICPVRSCRRMLPSLIGLGKHFCNSHRAVSLNDNMDGTLSDVGNWTDPTRGDGKKNGGPAKPPLVVSRKPMSLEMSPMVNPVLHANGLAKSREAREASDVESSSSRPKRPSQPSRGGPRQISGSVKVAALDDNFEDSGSETSSSELPQLPRSLRKEDRRKSITWTKFSDESHPRDKAEDPTSSDSLFTMANSERRYDQWPGKDGKLKEANGALFPDGYEKDTTIPDRPWICPIRSCRRLFAKMPDLGVHFYKLHRGCLLNDNRDGTFSILTKHDRMSSWADADAYPRVVDQSADNKEPLKNPQRPIYRTPTNIKWVDVFSEEVGVKGHIPPQSSVTPAVSLETVEEAAPVGVRNDNRPALIWATDKRLYSQYHDPDKKTGELISMAGALIPAGYKRDRTFYERHWICPVRTCRITCKLKKGLGNHFTHSHAGQTLNDNGDGTFSIVGSYLGKDPKVVSKDPLAADAPPIAEAQIPFAAKLDAEEERLKALRAYAKEPEFEPEAESSAAEPKSDPEGLWRYISKVTRHSGPPPDHPGIQYLLKQPRVRELVVTGQLSSEPDARQIGAMLIQVTGKEHERSCTVCRRGGLVPFDPCVNTVWSDSEGIIALFGSYMRSCANCLYLKNGSNCSVKSYNPAGTRIKPNYGAIAVFAREESLGEDDYYSMENKLKRRRSERLRSPSENTNSNEKNRSIITAADHASVDELLPTAKRPRREVDVSDANKKAPEPRRKSTIPDSDSPSLLEVLDPSSLGEDTEMEDWEQTAGKVLATAAPGRGNAGDPSSREFAFSSTHLLSAPSDSSHRQGRTIQVAKGLSFVATHIPSGTVHRIEPVGTRLRLCTLANGKLRVTVDGEPEFAIGAHGAFKLSPGKGCRIVNRAYVDAVLHVTGVEGAE